jgi:hypothetical protein
MKRELYCVYNQTSECFLSLGVAHHTNAFARLKCILAGRSQRYDEGHWMDRPRRHDLLRLFSPCDFVFLDNKNCVVAAIESFPPFRVAPVSPNVESVLALPVRTIYSSQTQPGNQLVICVAEEMEFRLRSMPDLQECELCDFSADADSLQAGTGQWPLQDRRTSRRKRWPRLVAYDSTGGTLEVHGVRDLGSHGLYLMTGDRWPLGTQVTMTLQRTDALDDNVKNNVISAARGAVGQ